MPIRQLVGSTDRFFLQALEADITNGTRDIDWHSFDEPLNRDLDSNNTSEVQPGTISGSNLLETWIAQQAGCSTEDDNTGGLSV